MMHFRSMTEEETKQVRAMEERRLEASPTSCKHSGQVGQVLRLSRGALADGEGGARMAVFTR